MTRSDSRERFIQTTARLLQERGFAATNMADIVAESGAPKGSLYFHFPKGKDELVAAAIAHSGEKIGAMIGACFASASSVEDGFEATVDEYARFLEQTQYRAGCPVGIIATEAPDSTIVREAIAAAFQSWHTALTDPLTQAGASPERADELATFLLTTIEGSLTVAKAQQSLQPLERAKREIAIILQHEGLDRLETVGRERI